MALQVSTCATGNRSADFTMPTLPTVAACRCGAQPHQGYRKNWSPLTRSGSLPPRRVRRASSVTGSGSTWTPRVSWWWIRGRSPRSLKTRTACRRPRHSSPNSTSRFRSGECVADPWLGRCSMSPLRLDPPAGHDRPSRASEALAPVPWCPLDDAHCRWSGSAAVRRLRALGSGTRIVRERPCSSQGAPGSHGLRSPHGQDGDGCGFPWRRCRDRRRRPRSSSGDVRCRPRPALTDLGRGVDNPDPSGLAPVTSVRKAGASTSRGPTG